MQLDLKARISRVIYFTLNLLDEIHEFPEEVDSEECRSTILSLLNGFEDNQPNPETAHSVRYALTAWVDDIFSRTPWPHSAYWNSHLLEQELFGTTCRQWRFFEQAEAALYRKDWTALSVYHLCVKCGFRGIYAKNRMKVHLNDRLPMARLHAEATRSVPLLAGMLQEESSGVRSAVDWDAPSNPIAAAPEPNATDAVPRPVTSASVLPPTLTEWCQTTFWALGHRNDNPMTEPTPLDIVRRALPSKRILTEWTIVMVIGVLLSVVLVSLGLR